MTESGAEEGHGRIQAYLQSRRSSGRLLGKLSGIDGKPKYKIYIQV